MVIPKSGGRRGWATDPDAYPVLTVEDRRRLAFGTEDKKHRTRADQDAAWEELPGVEIVSRTATTQDGQSGWVTLGGGDEPLVRRCRYCLLRSARAREAWRRGESGALAVWPLPWEVPALVIPFDRGADGRPRPRGGWCQLPHDPASVGGAK